MPDDSMFCGVCGEKVVRAQESAQVQQAAQPVQQQFQQPVQPQPIQQNYQQPQYQQPQQFAPQYGQQPVYQGGQAAVKSGPNKNMIIGIIAAVVIVAIIACIFIFGGSGGSSSTGNEKLDKANANAQRLFTALNTTVHTAISNGEGSDLEDLAFNRVIAVKDLKHQVGEWNSYLADQLDKHGITDGYIYFDLDGDYEPQFAQWAKSKSGIVGQYPDPETDGSKKHKIGSEF